MDGAFSINSLRRPTLPHSFPCSTIGPERLNFRVRDGNGCGPLGIATEKLVARLRESLFSQTSDLSDRSDRSDLKQLHFPDLSAAALQFISGGGGVHRPPSVNFYGQASRPISTGKLNALLRLHTQPINVVVYNGPSGDCSRGYLILKEASRLDAFSGYPFRT